MKRLGRLGQVRLGWFGWLGWLGQLGWLGWLGQLGQFCQLGQFGQLGQLGQVKLGFVASTLFYKGISIGLSFKAKEILMQYLQLGSMLSLTHSSFQPLTRQKKREGCFIFCPVVEGAISLVGIIFNFTLLNQTQETCFHQNGLWSIFNTRDTKWPDCLI